jgi:hypothetical protein
MIDSAFDRRAPWQPRPYGGFGPFPEAVLEAWFAYFREVQRSMHAENVRIGIMLRSRRGKRHSVEVPYGFRARRIKGVRKLIPNRDEFRLMKRVYELREQGATIRAIQYALRRAGVRTRRGGEYSISAVLELDRRFRRLLAAGKVPTEFRQRLESAG